MKPLLAAAAVLGRLVAWGLLPRDEAFAFLTATARVVAPHRDRFGREARLAWALDDAAAEARHRARRAVWPVRDALAPLLEAGAGASDLIAAGFEAAGDALPPHAARALIESEVRRHLARRRRA
jgi:hypothetical protein